MGTEESLVSLLLNILDPEEKDASNEGHHLPNNTGEIKWLALHTVEFNRHLIESLLDHLRNFPNVELPTAAEDVFRQLSPVHKLLLEEITIEGLAEIISCDTTKGTRNGPIGSDLFEILVRRLRQSAEFCVWCLQQPFLAPAWNASSLFQLCLSQPARLKILKTLGGLFLLHEDEIGTTLGDDGLSVNLYRGFLAATAAVQFLLQDITLPNNLAGEDPVGIIAYNFDAMDSDQVRLELLEIIFCLIFLRREDVASHENSTSDSAGEEEIHSDNQPVKANRLRDQSFSSPNSQSHSGSTSLAINSEKKLAAGFLCRDGEKLQVVLKFLFGRLNGLETLKEARLELRRQRLMQYVSEALWRLELLEPPGNRVISSVGNFSCRDGNLCVSKSWLAKMNPAVQKWFDVETSYRKPKKRHSAQHLVKPPDENLVNRLLSQAPSLLVACMTKQQMERASQVLQLFDLNSTFEGAELNYTLAHVKAIRQLPCRSVDTGAQSATPTASLQSAAAAGLNSTSFITTLESSTALLPEMPTAQNEESSPALGAAVALADVVLGAALSVSNLAQGLNYVTRRVDVDLAQQPWKSLKLLSTVFDEWRRHASGADSPWRNPLPYEPKSLENYNSSVSAACEILEKLKKFVEEEPTETVDNLVQDLATNLRMLPTDDCNYAYKLVLYFKVLYRLVPASLRKRSIAKLMHEDLDRLILDCLEETESTYEDLEIPARILGIELPSLLAGYLTAPVAEVTGALEENFLSYLQRKHPVLAETASIGMRIVLGDKTESYGSCDVYRRFLVSKHSTDDETSEDRIIHVVKPTVNAETASDLDVRSELAMLENMEKLREKDSTPIWLSSLNATVVEQVKHLGEEPVLILEQLLMNRQIGAAGDLLKSAGKHPGLKLGDAESVLFHYAGKALFLGLPSIAADNPKPSTPVKTPHKFVLPVSTPTKEQWVRDEEVLECPCCSTTQFSMFNRRHHCRRCGRVVCGSCSPHRVLVSGYGDVPVRVCADCYRGMNDDTNQVLKKTASDKGHMLWSLSLAAGHNEIVKREFSYEHVPDISLALAILNLSSNSSEIAAFLLNQSGSIIGVLHQHLLKQTLTEIDPVMLLQLAKSLVLAAKMRYSNIVATPHSKARPSRGLARCDALLSQVDILSLLASANCLSLLPTQPLSQLDTWRKLRDRLMERELWTLALDVSTKAGLDAGTVWATWGLDCLRAGNFVGARQRFSRCLKPAKNSPLLQEVISTLENLNITSISSSKAAVPKRMRRQSSPNVELLEADKPMLVIASLARLQSICEGNFPGSEKESKNEEILYYLNSYGSPEASYVYLIEKMRRIDCAVNQFSQKMKEVPTDVFINGLLLPCLRCGRLDDFISEMKRNDATLHSWKSCLHAASQHLESTSMWHSLYQFYSSTNDFIRASLTALRKLYLPELSSLEVFVSSVDILEEVVGHLLKYQSLPQLVSEKNSSSTQFPLSWPEREVQTLLSTVRLQIQVTRHVESLYREGRMSGGMLNRLKSSTNEDDVYCSIPSLLGSRNDRCLSAVLVVAAGANMRSLELAWKVCREQRVRLDKFFETAAFYFIREGQAASFSALVDFVRQRLTPEMPGYFDMDNLLLECAKVAQETKSVDPDAIVQQIRKNSAKIEAFVLLGWLKAAYLLAVKNNQVPEMVRVQKEAEKSQQQAILNLCNKWLAARTVSS